MVQYCFTSTETIRLVRTDSPGRPPRLSHSSRTMILRPVNQYGYSRAKRGGGGRKEKKRERRLYITLRRFRIIGRGLNPATVTPLDKRWSTSTRDVADEEGEEDESSGLSMLASFPEFSADVAASEFVGVN